MFEGRRLVLMYTAAQADRRVRRELDELRVSIEALKWEVAQQPCPKCGAFEVVGHSRDTSRQIRTRSDHR